jgi:hypothetical protein
MLSLTALHGVCLLHCIQMDSGLIHLLSENKVEGERPQGSLPVSTAQ